MVIFRRARPLLALSSLLFGSLLVAACVGVASPTTGGDARLAMVRSEFATSTANKRPVLVVAHRGCWTDTAENSLAAIEACIAMGVDVVELDVRRTADGVLVLMHDESVDRTTNGRGRVSDLPYATIAGLRLKAGAGGLDAVLTPEAPPTFEAAMTAAKGRILINLDAKADVYADAFAILEKTGAIDQVIMKRRVAEGEEALGRQPPFNRVLAMPIIDETRGRASVLMDSQIPTRPAAVEVIFTSIDYLADTVQMADAAGVRVWVNTLQPQFAAGLVDEDALVNPARVWGRLIDAGVTIIQTDEPVALLEYLTRIGRRPAFTG